MAWRCDGFRRMSVACRCDAAFRTGTAVAGLARVTWAPPLSVPYVHLSLAGSRRQRDVPVLCKPVKPGAALPPCCPERLEPLELSRKTSDLSSVSCRSDSWLKTGCSRPGD